MSLEVVVLRCRGCGASLSVPSGLDQLACSYCGAAQVVRREGGVTFLERDVAQVKEGIARVETQVERIADAAKEVGTRISRLEWQGEMVRLDRERQVLLHKLEQGRLGCFGWAAVTFAVSTVVAAFERADARRGAIAFGGAVAIVMLIRASGRINLRRRLRALDAEFERISAEG